MGRLGHGERRYAIGEKPQAQTAGLSYRVRVRRRRYASGQPEMAVPRLNKSFVAEGD